MKRQWRLASQPTKRYKSKYQGQPRLAKISLRIRHAPKTVTSQNILQHHPSRQQSCGFFATCVVLLVFPQ